MAKRGKYKLKRRARRQEETRLRITEATVELHGTVGPARTTISAVAEKAGVQRHTVYSHFPDELSLFKACSSHDLAQNPPPDPAPWTEIDDPEARLRSALTEVYGYYRRRERIMSNVLRDAEVNENVRKVLGPMIQHWELMKDTLAAAWEARDEQRELLLSAIGLALDFKTWHTLVRQQGLDGEQAVELMARMVRCVMHA